MAEPGGKAAAAPLVEAGLEHAPPAAAFFARALPILRPPPSVEDARRLFERGKTPEAVQGEVLRALAARAEDR